MPSDSDDSAAPETETLIWGHDVSSSSGLRWAGRLAVAAGTVASFAGFLTLKQRFAPPQSTIATLSVPFKLYDTSSPDLLDMPDRADQYDGVEDKRPVEVVEQDGETHIFALGDWGGTLPSHAAWAVNGGWDMFIQQSIAGTMQDRAQKFPPQYVLNVGDNFYVSGLSMSCNAPPSDVYNGGTDAFTQGWQSIYGELANKPWLSVLGNHDYGGWRMDQGWPQQIGYSFINYNWIMPGRWFNKKIQHSNYNVEYFMLDSNHFDAKDPSGDQNHNICSGHNYGGVGTCAANGGMPNIEACKQWFWEKWDAQKEWMEGKIAASTADWKIVITHFPCGYDAGWYKELKANHGLDLIVTGHRHQQELWKPDTKSKYIQSFLSANGWDGTAPACFVTGGGGGISSQKFSYADYGEDLQWYGFFHLTMRKESLKIELIGSDGSVHGTRTIYPHGSEGAKSQAQDRLNAAAGQCESYCGDSNNPWDKVCPGGWSAFATCAGCEGCH